MHKKVNAIYTCIFFKKSETYKLYAYQKRQSSEEDFIVFSVI